MKKILMLLALAGVTSVASAQQTTITGYEVIQVQDKYQVITNPFWIIGFSLSAEVLKHCSAIMTMSGNSGTVSVRH